MSNSTGFPSVWSTLVVDALCFGEEVAPRGQLTKELRQKTIRVDMTRPVLTIPRRKLNYRFMAAEAYWILTGDDRVSTIVPYNKRIAEFSDDGETFFGAYGPKVISQLPYVVDKLREDPDTRQAGLTIWRESPPKTKDVPCTVAVFFGLRKDLLDVNVFMRSSDIWLGVPYDVFNFSMLGFLVCSRLNRHSNKTVRPGTLHLTAASSHLYERDWKNAQDCADSVTLEQGSVPTILSEKEDELMSTLRNLRFSSPGDDVRWWEKKL